MQAALQRRLQIAKASYCMSFNNRVQLIAGSETDLTTASSTWCPTEIQNSSNLYLTETRNEIWFTSVAIAPIFIRAHWHFIINHPATRIMQSRDLVYFANEAWNFSRRAVSFSKKNFRDFSPWCPWLKRETWPSNVPCAPHPRIHTS